MGQQRSPVSSVATRMPNPSAADNGRHGGSVDARVGVQHLRQYFQRSTEPPAGKSVLVGSLCDPVAPSSYPLIDPPTDQSKITGLKGLTDPNGAPSRWSHHCHRSIYSKVAPPKVASERAFRYSSGLGPPSERKP